MTRSINRNRYSDLGLVFNRRENADVISRIHTQGLAEMLVSTDFTWRKSDGVRPHCWFSRHVSAVHPPSWLRAFKRHIKKTALGDPQKGQHWHSSAHTKDQLNGTGENGAALGFIECSRDREKGGWGEGGHLLFSFHRTGVLLRGK